MDSTAIRFGWFLAYKFFNSLFLGLSIGAVFTLYEPLSPAIFSAGGIGLALSNAGYRNSVSSAVQPANGSIVCR